MSSDNYIRKQFQEKFNDFKGEVSPDGWKRLEAALDEAAFVALTPRRRWHYAVASAAAVLLLIVGSVLFIKRPWEQIELLVAETVVTDTVADEPVESKAESLLVTGTVVLEGSEASVKPGAGLETTPGVVSKEVILASPLTVVTSDPLLIGKKVEEMVARVHTVDFKQIVPSIEASDRFEEEALSVVDEWDKLQVEVTDRPEREEPLLLALGGRGGLHSYQQVVNTPMTLRSASSAQDMTEEASLPLFATRKVADNVSEMEHDQPISFGITLSKELIDGLSIESGLVYSYLFSKVRNESSSLDAIESQHLHYIGVPLNVNYTVFSLNKLNLYASVGGMIEKDVYGNNKKLSEEETIGNGQSLKRKVEPISQRNSQLSLNVGVGLSYPLYNRLRLYGKIGGAYYFDAENEYKTIYSDQKIVFDLNVGLRYEF
ncbi:MAG: outer membrane beta-barrel protein [Fermentimonas sp.]